MGQTLFDKVWKKHVLHGKEGEPQPVSYTHL